MSKMVQVKPSRKSTASLITTTKPKLLDIPHFRMLVEMLTFRRPAFSKSEEAFIQRFIVPTGAQPDSYGNYWLTVGDDMPTVMFSSHTDTVHISGGRQRIYFDETAVELFDPKAKDAECLGADCTTGVWLMLQMIEAKVPGLYVFHRDEEYGCRGAEFVQKHLAESLVGIQAAIAFDRKGVTDVITHQCGYRCASDKFARSLAKLLPAGNEPSDLGVVTDTERYTRIIPECTNISVGYYNQHTANEVQDVRYALKLREHLINADWSSLVIARDPAIEERPTFKTIGAKTYRANYTTTTYGGGYDEEFDGNLFELTEFVRARPATVAKFLDDLGYNMEDIMYEISRMRRY